MSKKTIPKALPKGPRTLADLLDRDYAYVHDIPWVDAGDGVWTYAVPALDIDPTLEFGGELARDVVWGYVCKYEIEVIVKPGTPRERKAKRTRTPRRGFMTEARAIAFARAKIEASTDVSEVHDDTPYIGDADTRAAVDRAYIEGVFAGASDFSEWERRRALLPG